MNSYKDAVFYAKQFAKWKGWKIEAITQVVHTINWGTFAQSTHDLSQTLYATVQQNKIDLGNKSLLIYDVSAYLSNSASRLDISDRSDKFQMSLSASQNCEVRPSVLVGEFELRCSQFMMLHNEAKYYAYLNQQGDNIQVTGLLIDWIKKTEE